MNVVAIYPGRFQPFGPHHKRAFDWLCSKFGVDNCWISTSDSVDAKSPLSFVEKSAVIRKFGISNILQSSSPYRLTDSRFDPSQTILFVMLGSKDEGRIQYFKKDGTPGYYKEYYGQRDLETMDKSGYVVIAPHISIKDNGRELSGTYLRETLPDASESIFRQLMGWYDGDIHKLFQERFHEEIEAFSSDVIGHESNVEIKQRRHIEHLYETMSRDDMIEVISGLLNGNIRAFAKFDGMNLKVNIKTKLPARNKADFLYPLTPDELSARYADRPMLKFAFRAAHDDLAAAFSDLSNDLYANVEIVHPDLCNIYGYGEVPLIVLHHLLRVSSDGKIQEYIDPSSVLRSIKNKKQSTYTIIGPNRIHIPKMPLYASQLSAQIKKSVNVEQVIDAISYNILSRSSGYLAKTNHFREKFSDVSTRVDSKVSKKYYSLLENIDFGKLLPFEGIVFTFKGNMYKMTGYYKYQNQIINVFRK